jgi:hypothetical protein
MTMTMIVTMAAAVGMGARAEVVERKVTVYVEDSPVVPSPVLAHARDLATKIFHGVGVRIDWHSGHPSGDQLHDERAIAVSMAVNSPADYLPGALASAQAFDGVHITVFWDRVEYPPRPAPASVILGHVLVHEITHLLQGINRHSESGIMKARWTHSDYVAMAWKPLPFTPHDILLLHLGREE